ncbi:MAG: hypothetical protein ACRCUS_05735, partial [Anaerovoracaceae bacterium]
WSKTNELVKQINLEEGVVYHFFDGAGLEKGIKVQPEWAKYIANNRQKKKQQNCLQMKICSIFLKQLSLKIYCLIEKEQNG